MFTVISYYTPNYADEARRLLASCQQFGLQHEIVPVQSLGSWQRNTQYKAEFLCDARKRIVGPVVWLDADAVVRQYPVAFDVLSDSCDIAVHYRSGDELLSGTVWLGDTHGAGELLAKWGYYCRENQDTWDQKCLDMAIGSVPGLRVHRLPAQYTFIFDTMKREHPDTNPVIEHFQASRRFRHV